MDPHFNIWCSNSALYVVDESTSTKSNHRHYSKMSKRSPNQTKTNQTTQLKLTNKLNEGVPKPALSVLTKAFPPQPTTPIIQSNPFFSATYQDTVVFIKTFFKILHLHYPREKASKNLTRAPLELQPHVPPTLHFPTTLNALHLSCQPYQQRTLQNTTTHSNSWTMSQWRRMSH